MRCCHFLIGALALFCLCTGRAQEPPTSTPESAARADPAYASIRRAIQLLQAHDIDEAARQLDTGIKLNPRSTVAHVLRGAIYASKKQWPQAEQEYLAAEAISPSDPRINFSLGEIKFSEKQYDAARADYLPLEHDPNRGDLAAYEVFLCDLAAGHDAVAAQEIAVLTQGGTEPSYYFGNAAWSFRHKRIDEGKGWLESAVHIFPAEKNAPYAQSLRDLGYLPLPQA